MRATFLAHLVCLELVAIKLFGEEHILKFLIVFFLLSQGGSDISLVKCSPLIYPE
jgi:hypothetical protein